ncbi:MAG: PAS domain S-box protein [Candidatus Bathyarchaeia archaeon]
MKNAKLPDNGKTVDKTRSASLYARSLLEASLDPLVTISAKGKITDVNRATELVTGCPREQLIGSDFSDYFTESEKARVGYKKVFTDGFVKDYPLAIRHRSGKITDVLYNAAVYRNETGKIQGVFAAARDITERKQAEEKLKSAYLYSRSLLESSLDPLVTISADGKITDVNRSTEEVTGYKREQLIGSDFSDYFTEPGKARLGYKKVFTDGYVRDYPLAIRHQSGKITDVLYNATIYRNEDGTIQGVFAAARDITERKIAEQKLLAASLYSRSLIEASLDPLVTISKEGKITDVNMATEDVTGYTREELIGSDFSDYFTEPRDARAGYQKVFTEGLVKDYPLAIRHKSGKITDVLYNASIYRNPQGDIQGVFAAARDVTERNAMENEIKQTMEKLKQSNSELEQFAYVASHDLQEPLRMVASYVQLLERRYKGKLDTEADEFIAYAVDGANRMRGLIEDLLTYSRVNRLGKPFEPTNVESTLDIVLLNLKASITENNALVTHDKLPIVMADGGQLVQLFQNLIGNAIKFHGKESPHVHVSAQDKENEYMFSVQDNGIGIAPEYFDRLFKIFQRLHTREEYPGSGIGLAVCKRIVERHGGRIWIESQVGKGSTIYFTLNKQKRSD